MGQAKCSPTKIRLNAVGSGIFGRLLNFENCRSKAASDVISSVADDYVAINISVKYCDAFLLNRAELVAGIQLQFAVDRKQLIMSYPTGT